MTRMGLSLNPETQRLIEERLGQGHYASADDLVQVALAALDQVEVPALDEQTLAAIERAEQQMKRGEVREWDDVKAELRAKYLGQ